MQHRGGIGEAGRLDHNAVEALDLVPPTPGQQIMDRVDEITTNGAAQTPRRHLDDILVSPFNQQMIDAGIPEFVDDDGGIAQERVLQQEVQQRRFPGTQKAGKDRDGNGVLCHGD